MSFDGVRRENGHHVGVRSLSLPRSQEGDVSCPRPPCPPTSRARGSAEHRAGGPVAPPELRGPSIPALGFPSTMEGGVARPHLLSWGLVNHQGGVTTVMGRTSAGLVTGREGHPCDLHCPLACVQSFCSHFTFEPHWTSGASWKAGL